ncbi:MAG: hypothetical protein E6G27_02525 [Actinobacteria bacterium]|nr:MAG: hypothetical protein E6G27_02525 [Actinomycetota bacterium]
MNPNPTLSVGVGGRSLLAVAVAIVLMLGLIGVMRVGGGGARPTAASTAPAAGGAIASAQGPSPVVLTGQQAMGLVSFDPSLLGYHVGFRTGRKDIRAQIDRDLRKITVYVSPGDALHRVAHDIAHELGHAYDARYLTPLARDRYLQARGRPSANWFPGFQAADYTALALSDYGTGAGDFAEVFALCHAPSPEFRSTLAPEPSDPCSLIPKPA